MKKLLALNFNNNLAKKVTIIALALAVVIGMSYLGSQGYLNMSIMPCLLPVFSMPVAAHSFV